MKKLYQKNVSTPESSNLKKCKRLTQKSNILKRCGLQYILLMFVCFFSKTSDAQWSPSGLQTGTVNVVFGSGNKLFAGLANGALISTDNGVNWNYTGISATHSVWSFGAFGSDIFAGTTGGLFRSSDNGLTWNHINYGMSLVQSITNIGTNLFVATESGGVYISNDSGTTWNDVNNGLTNLTTRAITAKGTKLFAGTNGGGVFMSSNNGASWTLMGLTNIDIRSFALLGQYIFVGTSMGIFRSGDDGLTWLKVRDNGLTRGLAAACGNQLFAGHWYSDGGVARSLDFGLTWSPYNVGLTTTTVPTLAVLGTTLLAGTWNGGVFISNIDCTINSASVCGKKFNDFNGDAVMNGSETGLAGWEIKITYNQVTGPVTVSATTDVNGNYCFNNLNAGNYTITETQKIGWTQTFPAIPGAHSVSLTTGQKLENINFGNKADEVNLGNDCVAWSLLSSIDVTSSSANLTGQVETIGSGTSSPNMSIFLPYIANGQKLGIMGGWLPGATDPLRYIEFKVSPNPGNVLTVNNVSFNYGDILQNIDFNVIKSQVYYSVNGTSWTQLGATLSYLNTSMTSFSMSISGGVQIFSNQTFYLRIHPYSTSGSIATTQSFAVHNNVKICGTTTPDLRPATVNPGDDITICQSANPTAIPLTGASVGGSAFEGVWSILSGGGQLSITSQTNSPSTVTYTPAPNYSGTVVLTLTSISTPALSANKTIIVSPLTATPAAITGLFTLCTGATSQLASTTLGGVWTSNSPGIATVDLSTGLVTGVSAGTSLITYTVGSNETNCISSVSQLVTINTAPTITSSSSASRCGSGTVVLGATTLSGIINWYSEPTGGILLGTGSTFTSPVISTTTIFYADVTFGGCTSAVRTAVLATVNALPIVSSPAPINVGGTIILSPNSGGTWTSSNPAVATINDSGLVTGITAGNATFTFTNSLTACSATTTQILVTAQEAKPCSYLCNADFEQFSGTNPPAGFSWYPQANIPCWKTTATDSQIEIWHSGYNNIFAPSGNYFAELNATQPGALYQEFTVNAPQTIIASFWHRGRTSGTDVMNVSIVAPNGTITVLGTYSGNNSAWNYYSTPSYQVTVSGTYTLKFESVTVNNGNVPRDSGNFLDNITVTCPSSICGLKYNDLNGDKQKQDNEPVISGWEINLSGTMNLTAITGLDGKYCFNNLPPGSYTIDETQQDGWIQTEPANPLLYEITLIEGQNIVGKNFGNRQLSSTNCSDFEIGMLNGWQSTFATSQIIFDGTNHYLLNTDKAGTSLFYNENLPFIGNWTNYFENGCGSLCYDVNFIYAGNPYNNVSPPNTMIPYIAITGNGFSAYFNVNPITVETGWHSICAPLSHLNLDGTLPSNSYGTWVMSTGTNSDWNSLLTNVTRVRLPIDPSSFQSEKIAYDNICIKNTGDCNPPKPLCCDNATIETIKDASGKAACSAKLTAICEVRTIAVSVTNGTLSNVNWNCSATIPTGYVGLSAYTFTPGNCLPIMTTSVKATTPGVVTITYDITYSNGDKCKKTINVECYPPIENCCEKVKVETIKDASGKATCSAKLTADCEVRTIAVSVTNGTLSNVNWNCTTNIPTGYVGLSAYTFTAGSCLPIMNTSINANSTGISTIIYDITFASGEKCRKVIELECVIPCCELVKLESILDAQDKAACSAKLTANCEVITIAVSVTNGTLSNVNWNCSATIPTGYVGLSAYTFTPGNCLPIMTTSVNATTSGLVTITYDITYANGEKCKKTIDLDCSAPIAKCCDDVKIESVVDEKGNKTCCAKIVSSCEVKSIAVILTNGKFSSASWNCPTKIPSGFEGKTSYTFTPEKCMPELTTCVDAIQSGVVTITYEIVFANGEKCKKTIRMDCSVSTDCVTPPSDMVLWLPGDGNTADISGLNNNATIVGGITYSNGKVSNAFRAKNYLDYLSVPNNASFNFGTGDFSADAWINTNNGNHYISIVDKTLTVGNNLVGYRLFVSQGKLCFQMGDGSLPLGQWVPNVQLADGQWHFVTLTVNRKVKNGGKIYIDGSLVLTFDPTGIYGSISNPNPLLVLNNNMVNYTSSDNYFFHVDELELFNRVLSEDEIISIYKAGSAGKCKYGSICGTKFNDLNGNGKRDEGEPGIANWKILLAGKSDLIAVTDKDGNYCFYNLLPGEYKINEELLSNWEQTSPLSPGYYNLNLPAGQNLTGIDFGNRLKPQIGSICGTKFNDLNGNGKRDEGEPGIADWTILLGGQTEVSIKTDKEGNFCFENLKPGEYKLGEANITGWIQIKPEGGSYPIILQAGQKLEGFEFGNMLDSKPASICGVKFNDLNGNGFQDDNEPGLSDWVISLSGTNNLSAVTDKKGMYCFIGLKPGTYTVSEINKPGWNQTAPKPSGSYTFTLIAGQNIKEISFGNQHEQICVDPPKSLVGWWPGDDNTIDLTVFANFGTLVNGATYAPGKVNMAFGLMGSTDRVQIPDRPNLNPGKGDFTIDCWIKTSAARGAYAILDKREKFSNQNISGYALFVVDGYLQLRLADTAGNGLAAAIYNDNSKMIADGQWHFVAATIKQGSNDAVTLYVDGVMGTPQTWGLSNLNYSNSYPLRIGEAYFSAYSNNSPASFYHNFIGLIDEVEIMNSALTKEELDAIYNAGSAGKCKPEIQLGSICGTKFNDLNGNGEKDARGEREPGIPNFTIKLTGPVNLTATTDANGNFCFNNLPPGEYTISEINQPGWIPTVPLKPNTYTIILKPNTNIDMVLFGNKVDPKTDCANPPSGMVGWWPGDNHAKDISGFNNNGNIIGGIGYESGKVLQSFILNKFGYISVPDSPSLNFGTGNFTIDTWVKFDNPNVNSDIVHKAYASLQKPNMISFVGYHLSVRSGKLQFVMGDGSNAFTKNENTTLIADGKWHFIAVTVDRKNITGGKIYVDGNLIMTFDPTSVSGSISNSEPTILFSLSNYSNQIGNQIDELELFNRLLTPLEISSLYKSGGSGKCKPASICGVKFNDLNQNGKMDEEDTVIPGWLISINGSANMSVRTEKDGSYCFTNLKPGSYTVSEEIRESWTQTVPGLSGTYSVNLESAQNLQNINFGNSLNKVTNCVEPPSGMVAWWTFDETSGTTANDDAGFNNSGVLKNGATQVQGKVLRGIQLDGINDYVEVPNQTELNFGTGDFSFDAWIQTTDTREYGAMLVDKRNLLSTGLAGYAILLINGKLSIQLAETWTSKTNYVSPVFVADGKWHHIAVTVSRKDRNGMIFYLDGVATVYGNPTLHPGSLNNSGPLRIGSQSSLEGYYFKGILDEIELFNRVITRDEIISIFNAGSAGKCKLGAICGTKYNDLNGNGKRDANENGISGWQIILDGPNKITTLTDRDGNYCFTNLPPGYYKVLEENRFDWQQKSPVSSFFSINLTAGQNISDLYFGNMLNPKLGSICGVKFNDLNGNGKREKDEPGISDWTIWVDGTTEFKITSDKNGEFCITNLKQGIYKISEQNRDGWNQTAPQSQYFTIELKEGEHIKNLEFGNMLDPKTASICGMKFNDVNGNGLKDDGEQGIAEWPINLTGLASLNTMTDRNGNYCFSKLSAGSYTIYEGSKPGWFQTAPSSGNYSISLKSGESITKIDFGNKLDPCLNETKTWSALGTGLSSYVNVLAAINGKLFAGGVFTQAGGVLANRLASWNETSWSSLGQGVNGWIATFGVKGSTLNIGGSLNGILNWDESNSIWLTPIPKPDGSVYAFVNIGQNAFAKGTFSSAGGVPTNSIAKWNGSNWLPLGSGLNGNGFESALAGYGNNLYVGGNFNAAGGVSANNIAKWDDGANTWSPLGLGVNGTVRALILIGSDLYVAGNFTTAGGISANRIAKWDGTSWSALGSGTNGRIHALAVIGTDLYVGGEITIAGGVPVNGIAKWDGTSWSALGTGVGGAFQVNHHVRALAVIGSDLYAAGYFETAGGINAKNIAKYSCSKPTSASEFNHQQSFSLEQNYPNPFNNSSTIAYFTPINCHINISLYDIFGKEIKVLVNELKDAGHHVYEFTPDDIVSGVYFYTLKTEGFTQSKKMIIMK